MLRRPGGVVEGNLSFFLLSVVFSTSRLDHPVLSPLLQIKGRVAKERILSAPQIRSRLELAAVVEFKTELR
jgi:hypothetical protein